MSRFPITTPEAPPPVGAYSSGIRAGNLVFLSGQTPRLPDGTRLDKLTPFPVQAKRALDNLEAVAKAAGLSLRDAVKVNVYLRRPEDAAAFDAIYRDYVAQPFPARALTISPFTAFDVEVDAVLLDLKVRP